MLAKLDSQANSFLTLNYGISSVSASLNALAIACRTAPLAEPSSVFSSLQLSGTTRYREGNVAGGYRKSRDLALVSGLSMFTVITPYL